jgi:hypothetical protein
VSNKLQWAKWFWSDWAGDAALNLCSLPARGLWMGMLCLMAQGEPYGTLTIKGRAPTNDELFALVAPRGTRRGDFNRWLAELERAGIARRDREGYLGSTRMQRDGALSILRSKSAKKAKSASDLHKQNGDFAEQKTRFASTEAEAEAEATPPKRAPHQSRKRRRKAPPPSSTFKNGYTESAASDLETIDHAEADDARPSGAAVVSIAGHLNRRVN